MLQSLKEVFLKYQQEGRALPAYNIDSFEIYQAVETVVRLTKLPCIVQLSSGEDLFIEAERLFILVKKAQLDGLPIYLNMDHGKDVTRLEKLVRLGFDMIHFDGSNLEFHQNLELTKNFVQKIKSLNPQVLIEVEFNKINLVDSVLDPQSFTDPSQAKDFMQATQADLLAVSIGNLHGVSTKLPENLNLDLLQNIKNNLNPNNYLVLHGGSGISLDQIKSAIKSGIVKININTDLRIQFFKSLNTHLQANHTVKVYELFDKVLGDLVPLIKNSQTNFLS